MVSCSFSPRPTLRRYPYRVFVHSHHLLKCFSSPWWVRVKAPGGMSIRDGHHSFVPQTVTVEGCQLLSRQSRGEISHFIVTSLCPHIWVLYETQTSYVQNTMDTQETAARLFSVDESITSFPKPNVPRGKGRGRDTRISWFRDWSSKLRNWQMELQFISE